MGEYRCAAHSLCNLKYIESKKVPLVFHNGSNYDYQFIIKELPEESEGQEESEESIVYEKMLKKA